jgi:hypothetical protein
MRTELGSRPGVRHDEGELRPGQTPQIPRHQTDEALETPSLPWWSKGRDGCSRLGLRGHQRACISRGFWTSRSARARPRDNGQGEASGPQMAPESGAVGAGLERCLNR